MQSDDAISNTSVAYRVQNLGRSDGNVMPYKRGNSVMRTILSAATLVALTAAIPVFAADLPMKAPAMIAPAPFSWTGCHIGGHLGGVFAEDTGTNELGVSRSHNASGFVGGGQIGCDYQFAPGWVVGVEGRAAWSSLKAGDASTVRKRGDGRGGSRRNSPSATTSWHRQPPGSAIASSIPGCSTSRAAPPGPMKR